MEMITITLEQIKKHDPCDDYGVLVEHLGGAWPMDKPFPMELILDIKGFDQKPIDNVFWAMKCLPEHDRIWRLYAVWCARQVQHLMTDQRSIDALDVAERFANSEATEEEMAATEDAAWAAARAAWAAARAAARAAAWAATEAATEAAWAAAWAAWAAAWAATGDATGDAARAATGDAARAVQESKLREILQTGTWME